MREREGTELWEREEEIRALFTETDRDELNVSGGNWKKFVL